jgi:predicted enzyme related to lactoylglutathione lyase
VKLVFRVQNVAEERARLEALGAQVLQRKWQNPEQSFDAVDPEGNIFQIAANVQ